MASIDRQDIGQRIADTRQQLSDEEYIRINYKSIIDSLVKNLIDIDPKDRQLFDSLLQLLLKTLDYNRRHPSPQRSMCFVDHLAVVSDKLEPDWSQRTIHDLSNENLLIKIIKLMLKDCDSEDHNNESVTKITDKLLKFVESLRILAKPALSCDQNPSTIAINNLILNTIRCIYILINDFKHNIISRDLNRFCGELLGIMKIYSFYCLPDNDISQVRHSALFPSPFIQLNGKVIAILIDLYPKPRPQSSVYE